MRKLRALFCVLSVCIICLSTFGTAFASDFSTIDEWDIDPWADLDELQGTDEPAQESAGVEDPAENNESSLLPTSVETSDGYSLNYSFSGSGSIKYGINSSRYYDTIFLSKVENNLTEEIDSIVEETTVSLDNGFMDVVRPILGTIVSIIAVVAFINTAEGMLIAVVSGVSYFQFLKGGSRDDN